ncbi:bifunctional acetaldehyde-CoA/alcohol dehydrogenase [Ligilactobacillus salivarius]|jgi:acetaldehyde dehydrogenase/alcohol dehydrogenase|uniref:bifunctional acetaldehyde-CoA/alcohol dehydrogenase n=1 Tax=Ligilactobacillus salivarius TaxID=1624 RepID=UPI000A2EB2BF|nr:bifunctional acetaldehyde-CoA/alcohol dehydrogenase [Ligilactobacillus salivarius]MYU59148.1 bifunctional acetaldehyde-CoA/alcohol dehydrogenase [Ligilactobacillus salivarius]MYU84558.1 bifunctional acetaldehyde-CoA/alcohol dehydrogenase [Ligilactobacillus salivarius]MYU91967.1 bifunctional acetaldehyde-CoA/alcohol dehydrogenase [Ligilactobacillus salivarius]MYY23258.1 bifunctional acetaldehyde-CoA/alcohol dehydrogenase [Ligilactobacillus salivarius]MYY38684.1 bifunctional acetaldehyde-CoA/
MVNKTNNKEEDARVYTDGLVEKALKAEQEYSTFSQEQVDKIVAAAALAGSEAALILAHEAVDETGRGVVEDKDTKNRFATENVYNAIKNDKTVGVIEEDKIKGEVKIAAPLGVLAGIVPTTNPTSTAMFKSLLALKTRNAIVFAFHPQAQKSSAHAAKIVYDAAVKAGAPKNIIQWIEEPSLEKTTALIQNPKIASILATGGPGMVNAALKSGNPSMGVGAGNGAIYVDHTAHLDRAVEDLLLSKRFDNGMICATENSAVVEAPIYDEWLKKMEEKGAYVVPKKDYKKIEDFVFNDRHGVNGPVAGKPARWIAEQAGVELPEGKDVMLFELSAKNIGEKLSSEKLSPLLSVYKAKDREDGIKTVAALLDYQGAGHNAAIQIGSQSDPFVKEFGDRTKAARILVNQPDSIGGIGDIYTDGLRASLTLGTGSWGKNSLSHNLSTSDLLNVKTVAKRRNRPQWVRLPEKIYYEKNAISYLQDETEDINRAFIVADPGMVKFGFVDKVYDQLAARENEVKTALYGTVRPDPMLGQTIEIAQQMAQFEPDTVIAIGGGSALDATKIARYIYEYSLDQEPGFLDSYEKVSEVFKELQQKFVDIRKRIVKFHHAKKTRMFAIPTTSGTGSEVTPYAVITDDNTHVKYPLTDYELTPQVSIVDPEFVMTVPKRTVALSGLDSLSHALESYVSVMASDFTRPWSMQAIKLVFENLEASYNYDPKHPTLEGEKARENMHYAATLAGMAFANAFLGINHSIAHKTGGEFGLPHGLAISIAMQHVIKFNGASGRVKRTPFPRYEVYRAQKDYADIARALGLKGNSDAELVDALCNKINDLMKKLDVEPKLSANGVTKEQFDKALDKMVDRVYDDQCTTANPRQPYLEEIRQLLIDQF